MMDKMTDLQLVRKCAAKMGIEIDQENDVAIFMRVADGWKSYDPLADDGQAMALMKQMQLVIYRDSIYQNDDLVTVWQVSEYPNERTFAEHVDLNRAICECVAGMP